MYRVSKATLSIGLLTVSILGCLGLSYLASAEDCPGCYSNNDPPMAGHGPASDGSGRRTIHVQIDSSWGTQTNVAIWNGTEDARRVWNLATDGAGHRTGYFLEVNQATTTPDIIIKKGPVREGTCGNATVTGGPPYIITLPESTANLDANDIKGVIAHEIGHPLGLDDDDGCFSIMNSATPGCHHPTRIPTSNDVAAVNKNFGPNRTTQCHASATPPPSPTPTPEECSCYDLVGCIRCQELNPCACAEFNDHSPVLVDAHGDGFSLTDLTGGVNFDLNGDGVAENLSWTDHASDDAWLAFDRNANGIIDSGQELFGNYTSQPEPPVGEERNGFLALGEYDKPANGGNADGVIGNTDAIFSSLRLWQDANHNGVSESSELKTLPQLGLATIYLDYKMSRRTDRHGNQFKYRAKVTDDRGAQIGRWAWDVFLTTNP